ncbi:hypothetical protein SARC_07471 [Sphaeroforma arctica JP610]|uniref:Uncharacterized protein n=1 Tax=Sphaeroforma arctica JP610 TaxID=667725 RepID=A0A0L0FW48_9EUKA|nr:hypothetical protein SARC_07471 [Sphaeroforma arctica JP610]KNC80158.1 hypothetical protein SARC_07471 [Sphaeroforma arctica JP610]|eukprot:XP_014154060.1 hypothetical protein SARC_07471 [Sphaeroforma arctica JP610]
MSGSALQDDAWEQSGSCQNVEETGKEGTAPISTKTKDCRRKRTSTKGHSRRQTSPDRKEGGQAQTYPYQTTEINTQLTHNKTSDIPGNLPASSQPNTHTHQRSLDSPLSDLKSSLEREQEMQKTKTEQANEIQQWLSKDTVGEAVGANSELDVHMNSHIHTLPRMLAPTSTGFGVELDDRLQAIRAHTHTYLEREAPHTYQERDESDLNLGTDEAHTNIENINTPTDVTSNGIYTGATPKTLDEHLKMNMHTKSNPNTTPQLHNRREPGPGCQPNLNLERKQSNKKTGQNQPTLGTGQVPPNASFEPLEARGRSQFADIFEWNAELPEVEGENSPEKLLSIILGPIEMEKLVWRGCLMFQDGLLYCVTILPIRFCFSLVSGLFAILTSNPVSPRHIHDTVQGIIIIVSVHLIDFLDIDEAYHVVLHLSWTRTWVLYNLFDVCDVILTAIGRRVMGSLMWSIRNKSWYIPLMTAIACLYVTLHSFAMTLKLATLHVAIDRGQLLFALLLAIKMPEFKGGNFTGMTKEDLLNTCLNDMVDRSKAMVFSLLIFMHKALRWRTHQPSEWVPAIASATLMVLGVEVLVDVIKHVAILTFNLGVLSHSEYYKLSLDLAKDLLQWTNKNSLSGLGDCTVSLLSDRFGYVTVPLTCILLRLWTRWYLIKTSYWMVRAEKLSTQQSISEVFQVTTETGLQANKGGTGVVETRLKETRIYSTHKAATSTIAEDGNDIDNLESSYTAKDIDGRETPRPDRSADINAADRIPVESDMDNYTNDNIQPTTTGTATKRYQLRACRSAPHHTATGDTSDSSSTTDTGVYFTFARQWILNWARGLIGRSVAGRERDAQYVGHTVVNNLGQPWGRLVQLVSVAFLVCTCPTYVGWSSLHFTCIVPLLMVYPCDPRSTASFLPSKRTVCAYATASCTGTEYYQYSILLFNVVVVVGAVQYARSILVLTHTKRFTRTEFDSPIYTGANSGGGLPLISGGSYTPHYDEPCLDETYTHSRSSHKQPSVPDGSMLQCSSNMQRLASEGPSTSDRRRDRIRSSIGPIADILVSHSVSDMMFSYERVRY